jgi:WD40 repeat protein
LDTFEALMTAGDYGSPPVTAADLSESEIYRLISSDDADERMPHNGDRLADSEIEVISKWILQGADFDGRDAGAPLRDEIPRDLAQPKAPQAYPAVLPVTALAFTTDGAGLLVGGYHEILVCDPASGKIGERVGNVAQRTYGMALSSDGQWLAVAGGAPGVAGEVRLISWAGSGPGSTPPRVLARLDDVFFSVAFRPDGKQLAAGSADGRVRIFDVMEAAELRNIEIHADWVADLAYSPDGGRLATASRDKTAKVFDAETGALLSTYSELEAPVRAVGFSPDGQLIASGGGSSVRIWKAAEAATEGELGGFGGDVTSLVVGGDSIAIASVDQSVRVFRFADRSLVRTMEEQPAPVMSLAWHLATHRIAAGCFDGSVTVRDAENGAIVSQFKAAPEGEAGK